MINIVVLLGLMPILSAIAVTPDREGPYHVRILWTQNPSKHAVVSWTTFSATQKATVYFDTQSREGDLAAYTHKSELALTGEITLTDSDMEMEVPRGHYNHAEMKGLNADSRYYFVVESDGKVSEEMYFITAPDSDKEISLFWGGDSRMGAADPRYAGVHPHENRKAMNRLMSELLAENPNIYALAHGADWGVTADWRHLYWWFHDHELTTTEDGRVLPLIASRGNHDRSIGFEENFWLGEDLPTGQYYYTSQLTPEVALVTLNTEVSITGDQRQWLEKELASLRPNNRWLMVQYHVPAYPAVKDFNATTASRVRNFWVPLFEEYQVDLAAEADGHCLKRTLPIKGGKHDPEGVIYIGEGGLGVPQRETDNSRWFVQEPGMATSAHHVFLIDFRMDGLRTRAIGMDKKVLDDHELQPRMVASQVE
ncbi:purple acid phosphatase family protein [Pleomorphovibrio marinus]|uniref:purple acid phosphatase family protein n=1 Tax=Pleomorphovibrio marinus TaxID=2164132 RepID=UPI000E0A6C2F|nr:metallophosphoesterase family protein [Pleomorphovibrio marinus]